MSNFQPTPNLLDYGTWISDCIAIVTDPANPLFGNPGACASQYFPANPRCNPPDAGLGLRPTASAGVPLLDAYLWVKTPGQSDGSCDSAAGVRAWDYTAYTQPGWPTDAASQALFDPLWGIDDPAAGA